MCKYSVEILTATLSCHEFVAIYRDVQRIEGYCKACPCYGQYWCCPPFESDIEERLRGYAKVLLVALKVTPATLGTTWSELEQAALPERTTLERRLLQLEASCNGLACHAGRCRHCPNTPCSRSCGKSCRHPQLMRPSLEAYGFDLTTAMTHIFHMPLLWSTPNHTVPQYLTYISALFHNGEDMRIEGDD